MKRLIGISIAVAGLSLAVAAGAAMPAAAPPNLGGLEKLVGKWSATGPDGKVTEATYELSAGGSALVEHLGMGESESMVTVYHRDGDALMLTHYCMLQNQPRMRAAHNDGKVFDFAFVDATNLASADAPHMHSLKVTLVDADHFDQDWTFHQGGQQQVTSFHFTRVK
jgi:hypothetical protein